MTYKETKINIEHGEHGEHGGDDILSLALVWKDMLVIYSYSIPQNIKK